MSWAIELTETGRVVVPPSLPDGFALFYTTIDFDGRLDQEAATRLMRVAHDLFGVEATLSTCVQVHGTGVVRATSGAIWRECGSCDALFSSALGTALGIKVADCLPVTIADMKHGVIANIHSGWRGAAQKITAESLDVVIGQTNFETANAQAWLGPSIRVCCFEVGEEVVDQFRAQYAEIDLFVDRGSSKAHIDIPGLTSALLIERGLAPNHIHDSALCTRCDGSIFHSYRRQQGGRNLAIAAR